MVREQYEVSWKDYYEILQVHPRAEAEVITAAYRKLAQMYHPDRNKSEAADGKFKEINGAHEVLSDENRRARYDQVYWTSQSIPYDSGSWSTDAPEWSPQEEDESRWEHTWDSEPYPRHPNPQRHFLPDMVSALVARLSPNPDESQRIIPWPSWSWQRVCLMGSLPLAALMLIIAAAGAIWPLVGFAVLFLGLAVYAAVATHWMRATRHAPPLARAAGGACIVLSGLSYALGTAYAVLFVVFMVLIMMLAGAMLKAMLEGSAKRYK